MLRGAQLYLLGFTTFKNNIMSNVANKANEKLNEGGALTLYQSEVTFNGPTYFYNNTAERGAAVHVTNSNVHFRGTVIIANNTAKYNGGGLYLYQSVISFIFTSSLKVVNNHALNNGGGIYAACSTIDVYSLTHTHKQC